MVAFISSTSVLSGCNMPLGTNLLLSSFSGKFLTMKARILQLILCASALTRVAAIRDRNHFPLHASGRGRQHCVLLSKEYHSSELEQTWLDNVHVWSNDFCSHAGAFSKETQIWLDTIMALQRNDSSVVFDEDIFSSFVSTYDCSGEKATKKTWIEPLSHGLRHPLALCGGGAGLVDRDYLLLASRAEYLGPMPEGHGVAVGCAKRPHENIFVDLGASTWNAGAGGPSQSWFYDSYRHRGLEFDRLLLWEAQQTPAEEILSVLPKELWHKYQYFNWPASSNTSDPSSPLNIIKEIADPDDFVVLKLDIDTPDVEMKILRELLSDPELLGLVDEFYFEDHVLFEPMNPSWFQSQNPSPPPTNRTLGDSYRAFHVLRQMGVRAHSWV